MLCSLDVTPVNCPFLLPPLGIGTAAKMPEQPDSEKKFQYAPKHPDGDPWTIILKPMLDSSNAQCDIWKDEVQNLLIFAGLFSAVVTGFLVESYKSLVPDPQDTMVLLLSQIVQRLDNPSNLTAATSAQLPNTPLLQQNPVYNRINSFWFLSLILSLATVLIGIISLQWLREHRNYSDPSLDTKQIFSVFRVRDQGLKIWKIPMLFELLPVLLQVALVLFLAGMVDFTRQLGNSVFIPAMIATAFTLMFLLATTMLPASQKAWIYVACLISKQLLPPPSQCPYKSPQSKAFYALCRWAMRGTASLLGNRLTPTINIHKRVIKVLSESWSDASWQKSDIGWLHLRDTLSFADFYNSAPHPILEIHTLDPNHDALDIIIQEIRIRDLSQLPFDTAYPIFDIINGFEDVFSEISKRGLVAQSNGERYMSAAYHCFSQISLKATSPTSCVSTSELGTCRRSMLILDNHMDYREYHHRYFQYMFCALAKRTVNQGKGKSRLGDDDKQGPSLLDFFAGRAIFSTLYDLNDPPMLLHYENLGMFLSKVKELRHTAESLELERHLVEVKIRAVKEAFTTSYIPLLRSEPSTLQLAETSELRNTDSLPEEMEKIATMIPSIISQDLWVLSSQFSTDANLQIQLLSTISTFLDVEGNRICRPSTSYKQDWRNTPFGYRYISNLLYHSALAMKNLSESTLLPSLATDVDNVVQKIWYHIYTGTLRILHRDDDVDSAGVVKTAHHMLFFYVSKITLDCLLAINDGVLLRSHTDRVYVVRELLRTVKRDIWQKADNGRDFTIETNFKVLLRCPWIQKPALFSETWWKNMDDEPSLSSFK